MPQIAALPSWISLDGVTGDLGALLAEIDAWADLARHWRAIGSEMWKLQADAPVDSPVRLAAYLAAHIGDDAVAEIFKTLGLQPLHAKLVAHGGRLGDPGAPWAKLLKPMSDFTTPSPGGEEDPGFGFDAPGEEGELSLSIPKLAGNAGAAVGPTSLTFEVGARGGIECEAGAPWPFRSDAVEGGLLRVGIAGSVTTRAGLSLPFGQAGEGTAKAGASAEAAASFFYRPNQTTDPYGDVLFKAVAALPSPLDLGAISHAMALAGLEGIALGCDGAVDAGLGLLIGKSIDLPRVASGKIGITADVSVKRSARWILSLRRTADGMRFVLSRDELRDRKWAAGIDLRLDAAPLARRVHDLLTETQDFAGPVLGRIKPFLSPGTYMLTEGSTRLEAAVASIIGEPALREAIVKDLALTLGDSKADTSALADLVAGKIADLAATQAEGIFASVDMWTGSIVDGLIREIPLLAKTGLDAELKSHIDPLLGGVKSSFDQLLGSLTGDSTQSKKLAKELAAVGASIKESERTADKLLAGVREVVDKFQAFALDVIAATEDATKTKIEARLGWSGIDTTGRKYELIGTFSEATAETAELWRALVTGRLQPFQRILADPSLAPAGIRLAAESSLSRFAGQERGFALEVVVLGVELSLASIVKSEASITVNAAGDIAVSAKGSALRKVEGFNEGRSASFISSWDLLLMKADALSGGQRTLAVGVGLDHKDKDLKAEEVEAMLSGLNRQGLIASSRVDAALGVYQGWRVKAAAGGKVKGRIRLRLQLPQAAAERMVAIGRDLNRPGNRALLSLFTLARQIQIATDVVSQKQFDRDIETAKDHFTISLTTDDPSAYMVALWNSKIRLLPAQGEGPRLPALAQLVPRAGALATLLGTMAEIYDAVPEGMGGTAGGWTEKQYANAEKRLVSASRSWLKLNQDFVFWFKSPLHPALLAFLRLLVAMNRPAASGVATTDGLAEPLDPKAGNDLIIITMEEDAAAAPVLV